jgi:hypothetical protein
VSTGSSRMSALAFEPVTIRIGPNGDIRSISSVYEAANVLLEEWPAAPDESFGIVAYACREAFKGNTSPTIVRAAFIDAARVAGIYPHDAAHDN